jgi:hypothetical protein
MGARWRSVCAARVDDRSRLTLALAEPAYEYGSGKNADDEWASKTEWHRVVVIWNLTSRQTQASI